MSVSIDLDARRITASVGDLLGEASQRAIGISGSGLSRMWIGQELHRRVQQELLAVEPGYRAEVTATLELDVDGWTVEISGRADGVRYEDDQAVRIDEIKTLHFAVDLYNLFAQERIERFKKQVRLYAYMLSPAGKPADARLILVDIVTTEEQVEEVSWSFSSVHAWLRQQVHRLVAAEHRRVARLEELREAARLLPFPHPLVRPSQPVIGEAVSDTLAHSRHLLLRAPTGCGKTAAVLHPALRAALADGHRLFFLTAKTLQQRIAVETGQAMQSGLFRSLQLRAKSKMCANSEMICHEEHCPYAREYGIKLVRSKILDNLLDEHDHLDPNLIFDTARDHEVCPFEVSLDLLPEVDLVVCDYNYVFDPSIGLDTLLDGGALRNAVLVIDEAHNLVDRSREYFSPALDLALVEKARPFLSTRDNALFQHLLVLAESTAELIHETVADALGEASAGDAEAFLPNEKLSELRIALDAALLQYFIYKRENKMWMANDPVLEIFFAVTRFHRVLQLGGDEFIHLASRTRDGNEKIKIFCRDASRFVGATLDESAGAVAMSATLEPFDFYQDLLGFDRHRSDRLHIPSPFPKENRLVITIDDVDTTYRRRAAHYDTIAHWLARLAPPGHNSLALFPSYAFLEEILCRLPPLSHTVVAQQRGASDAEQEQLLTALSSGLPHLLLAVLGGIFAEGVDYPGKMLSQVVVVSPGLPQLNVERELLKTYYGEHYGHAFSYAYLIPGLTRVVQAAGRLIRSESDMGVIVLIGKRFQKAQYLRLLPDEWYDDDPESMRFDDPEKEVRRFFAGI
jgi:DNA excision repair protein ERCC-2